MSELLGKCTILWCIVSMRLRQCPVSLLATSPSPQSRQAFDVLLPATCAIIVGASVPCVCGWVGVQPDTCVRRLTGKGLSFEGCWVLIVRGCRGVGHRFRGSVQTVTVLLRACCRAALLGHLCAAAASATIEVCHMVCNLLDQLTRLLTPTTVKSPDARVHMITAAQAGSNMRKTCRKTTQHVKHTARCAPGPHTTAGANPSFKSTSLSTLLCTPSQSSDMCRLTQHGSAEPVLCTAVTHCRHFAVSYSGTHAICTLACMRNATACCLHSSLCPAYATPTLKYT